MSKRKVNREINIHTLNLPPSLIKYLERIEAEPMNFRAFIVKQKMDDVNEPGKGSYYREKASIWIKKGVLHYRSKDDEFKYTDDERKAIEAELAEPKYKPLQSTPTNEADAERQRKALGVDKENWYVLIDNSRKNVLMCQCRIDRETGGKNYIPWTKFGNRWMALAPDTAMPFWKPKEKSNWIMIHEGCKAARYVDWMCNSAEPEAVKARALHPWYYYLKHFQHWGITGGALAPQYADYQELRDAKPELVVYSCDRDHDGEGAPKIVSRLYGEAMFQIRYGESFKYTWDMRDPLPDDFFEKGKYIGPRIEELIHPATWATSVGYMNEDGKPVYEITKAFRTQWYHIEKGNLYVNVERPSELLSEEEFNDRCSKFSHTKKLSAIVQLQNEMCVHEVTYNPTKKPGLWEGPPLSFNTYSPPTIKVQEGDPKPFLTFMENLFPIESDRKEVVRWCATLSERPKVKIKYNLLLCSDMQGVGKTTLADIMAELVGESNVSYPNETEIVDNKFTAWKARRLAVCNEIYAGKSQKAYNNLKDLTTDKKLHINRKYMPAYDINNYCHVIACSNSMRALKLPDNDRRWLIPKVTEQQQEESYWDEFHLWLRTGGYGIIKGYFQEQIKKLGAVRPGAHAPNSGAKAAMIEESYSPGMALVRDTLEALRTISNKGGKPLVLTDKSLQELVSEVLYNGHFSPNLEAPRTIRRVASRSGWALAPSKTTLSPLKGSVFLLSPNPQIVTASPDMIRKGEIEIIEEGLKLKRLLHDAA